MIAAGVVGVRVALAALALVVPAGEVAAQWTAASPDRTLAFPDDHASHPAYRVEWWYYTGHLTGDGRRFGYQVTFFRVGVDPEPENPSIWAVRDLFMAHLAITDLDRGVHVMDERLNRAGVGWAGARSDRLEVWNEDWSLRRDGATHVLELMSAQGFGVRLRLEEGGPPVAHGRDGFSQKGPTPGNASHYYSFTRMPTEGTLVLDGVSVPVSGRTWMDHEFGTSFLEASQQGWDWFSLQLDDGTDLMLFQICERDGGADPQSSGTVVGPRTGIQALIGGTFALSPGRRWRSPTSGAAYPVEWRVEVPGLALELDVRAELDAQELHTAESTGVTYWEGAVRVTGTRDGRAVEGIGYLEMTGYVGRPMSEVLR